MSFHLLLQLAPVKDFYFHFSSGFWQELIMAASHSLIATRALFTILGCLMLATLLYTLITDGSPFRKELFTPWMAATLVDFYITVVAIAVWVAHKESSWISALVWILLLVGLGSITTCIYVVMQLFKVSSQGSVQGSTYHCLLRDSVRNGCERKMKYSSLIIERTLFSVLGCLMLVTLIYTCLTDGSPFRRSLLTPWMTATLVDFYINVVAISTWVALKESTWIGAFFWIVLLICFGGITTCVYIVIQLFQLPIEDPLYHVDSHGKQARTT